MKTFKLFLEWYKKQQIKHGILKPLKQQHQWFINIYNNKINIKTIHLRYLEYFNIKTQNEFNTPKCPYCNEYCGIQKIYKTMKIHNSFFLKTCNKRKCKNEYQKSNECQNKKQQTCLIKYNVKNPSHSEIFKEKSKQTCLKNNGVEYSQQSKKIREKGKQTKKEKYGDENYNNKEKGKQTKKEKYGDENYYNKEKYKETCLKEYGVENVFQSKSIKEKIKKIKKEIYNDENYNNKEKGKQTKIENGYWISNEQKIEFQKYRNQVDKYTDKTLKKEGKIFLNESWEEKRGKGKDKYNIDHKFSVIQGFLQNISPEIMGSKYNLQLISENENHSKYTRCSISKEELLKSYCDNF